MSDKTKLPDPRQLEFLRLYMTPGTDFYRNALQSGLEAGYTQEYSENILQFDLKWLAEGISELIGKPTDKKNLLIKAKKVLDRSLDSDDEKISQDTAKFIAKSDIEFSDKVDVTSDGKSFEPIVVRIINEPTRDNNTERV
jgi:hypothetical protein